MSGSSRYFLLAAIIKSFDLISISFRLPEIEDKQSKAFSKQNYKKSMSKNNYCMQKIRAYKFDKLSIAEALETLQLDKSGNLALPKRL